jgi:hypothetical protein
LAKVALVVQKRSLVVALAQLLELAVVAVAPARQAEAERARQAVVPERSTTITYKE